MYIYIYYHIYIYYINNMYIYYIFYYTYIICVYQPEKIQMQFITMLDSVFTSFLSFAGVATGVCRRIGYPLIWRFIIHFLIKWPLDVYTTDMYRQFSDIIKYHIIILLIKYHWIICVYTYIYICIPWCSIFCWWKNLRKYHILLWMVQRNPVSTSW